MFTRLLQVSAVLAALITAACSPLSDVHTTMSGTKATAEQPPVLAATVDEVQQHRWTRRYKVLIYPGTGANYNPRPTLTKEEGDLIEQFDHYCALQVQDVEGEVKEMLKQGGGYGGLQGVLGAMGYSWGFGDLVKPMAYLKAIGLTAAGGGIMSGEVMFESTLSVLRGYCMTLMVYKADLLEGKLQRITVAPLYVGAAKMPTVSDDPMPVFSNQTNPNRRTLPAPPMR